MRKLLVCLVILSSLALFGCQRGTQFGPEDTAALQQMMEGYMVDLREGDTEGIMELVVKSPRPLMYGVTSQKVQGWDETRASLEQIFAQYTIDEVKVTDSHHKGEGQLGVSYGEMMVQVSTNGASMELPIRFTRVYGKRDGRWELLHQHTSVPNDLSGYMPAPDEAAGSY